MPARAGKGEDIMQMGNHNPAPKKDKKRKGEQLGTKDIAQRNHQQLKHLLKYKGTSRYTWLFKHMHDATLITTKHNHQ